MCSAGYSRKIQARNVPPAEEPRSAIVEKNAKWSQKYPRAILGQRGA